VLARKSVKQSFASPSSIEPLMESFRLMCNDAIRIGLAADASSLKRLSKLCYSELRRYGGVPSCYKLCAISKAVEIAENTRNIVRSFRRNDIRIRKRLAVKYGRRRQDRVRQILNRVSKNIVTDAKTNRHAIAFENISGIRKLYRRGNGQGRTFRGKMNSWSFYELKRQVEYKAAWEGVPVVTLSAKETRGTTMDCPRCGERLQAAVRTDSRRYRQLWCEGCQRWEDRDLVAVMNISRRGWVRFAQSRGEGEAGEAVKGNPEGRRLQVILKVDASKLCHAQRTQ
jgi:putative transposase